MHLNPVTDAVRQIERKDAQHAEFAALEEQNRDEARQSFDAALTAGIHAPVWAPLGSGQTGLRRTKPLHDIVSLQADMAEVTALLLVARTSRDVTIKALADSILGAVREAHADDCGDAGLF